MRTFLIALALLTALAFVIVVPAVFSLVNMQQILSDPVAIKETLAGESLIDEAVAIAIRQDISELPILAGLPVVIRESEGLEAALDQLVSEEWVNAQSDRIVDSIFFYLESGDFEALTLSVEIAPLFNDLNGESGRALVRSTLEKLPVCTLDNLPQVDPVTGQLEIVACRPPLVPIGLIADQLHNLMSLAINEQSATQLLGETLTFNLLDLDPASRTETEKNLERVRFLYQASQTGVFLLWLVPLGLLVLTLILAVRSVRSFGFWLGGMLLFASALTILVALLMVSLLPNLLLGPAGSAAVTNIPGAIIDGLLRLILVGLLEKWQERVLLQAGLVFIAGLFFAGIGGIALLWAMLSDNEPAKATK